MSKVPAVVAEFEIAAVATDVEVAGVAAGTVALLAPRLAQAHRAWAPGSGSLSSDPWRPICRFP